MAKKRNLNDSERRLVFDLYNLGMQQDHIADFFDISTLTVYKIVLAIKKTEGEQEYSLAETSKIMTRYLLSSLARSMHNMTAEQKLRFLPDLLKIKEETADEGKMLIDMYVPKKES